MSVEDGVVLKRNLTSYNAVSEGPEEILHILHRKIKHDLANGMTLAIRMTLAAGWYFSPFL